MKLIKDALFLFYDYYRKGRWERVPVFHASASLSLLIWINAVSITCFAGDCRLLSSKGIVLLTLLMLLGIIFWLAKSSNIQEMQMSKRRKEIGGRILLAYIIVSIAVMCFSIYYSSSFTEPTLITPIR